MIKYAKRMNDSEPSIIREMLKLSLDPTYISFAGGDPDPSLFPIEDLMDVCHAIEDRNTFQYGISEGNENLRSSIVKYMKETALSDTRGDEIDVDNILVTTGSQQGLDLTGKLFIDEGDKVIVERPTYMGAINAFKQYGPEFIGVDMDGDGLRTDLVLDTLRNNPDVKFIYTIPDFQNPTGLTMSLDRRRQLVELATEYDVAIIEDNPYYMLRFDGDRLPPIKNFDRDGHVIYLGSFSKFLCPALRVGWIVADEDTIKNYVVAKQAADIHTNELSQIQASAFLSKTDIASYSEKLSNAYRGKKEAMVAAISSYLPPEIEHTDPQGGLFVWLTLPETWDANEVMERCIEERVAVIPGERFFTSDPEKNTLRLSYATMDEAKITEGVARIGKAIEQYIEYMK